VETEPQTSDNASVSDKSQPTDTPAPLPTDTSTPKNIPTATHTPIPELSFADIIQSPNEKGWTSTQYSTYFDTIKGRYVSGWSGTILEIKEYLGDIYLSLDMKPGEPKIDVYAYISKDDILKVGLGQNITFAGTIDSKWPENNDFYALQIKGVKLLELGKIPAPTLVPPTPTPVPTASKEDYIASANQDLTYKEVDRSDRHKGERVCWKGQVFNIEEEEGITFFQAWYFTGRHLDQSGDAFVANYEGILPDVYEETEVYVCGEIGEKIEGTNVLGGVIRQPSIFAKFVDLWEPEPLPAATATPIPPSPTPLARTDDFGVNKQVGMWDTKLYQVKRAKAVYFHDQATIAQGVWLLSFIEFKNLGSGTSSPWKDLDFYLLDDQGRTYEASFNDAWLGAKWQFQAGDIMDDINPGVVLGVVLPVDVPENLGDVWLRVEQDSSFAIYLGNASSVPIE
jgi:hypothetical protein